MQSKYLSLIILVAVLFTSCGAERNMKKGEEHLALGEYYDAATQFKKAYQQTPAKEREKRGQRALKMARCYAKINQTTRALPGYRNALRYNQATAKDRLAYARLLLKDGQYKLAEQEFMMLKDSFPDNILVKNGLISARTAPKMKKNNSSVSTFNSTIANDQGKYTVKRADIFNSRRADYSPMLYGDNCEQLYFTSTRNEAEGDELNGITGTKSGDIFFSEKNDLGKWSKPETAGENLNTVYDEGCAAFSADGKTMYLTQCVTDIASPHFAKIMTSARSDANWSKMSELNISRDTLSSYAHPAISPDGEWLYFTSDMPGGKGGLDIWRIRITANGLGGAENLGEPINTPGNEEFPTFRPNGDLYFSSDGHPGMGGLDIFIAKADITAHKYTLYHPGYPLNSQADDFGMTFDGVHNRGYFSSNRNDVRGYDHIYSFENPEITQTVKGWVYETDGYELPEAIVYFVGDDGTNLKLNVKGDGSFTKQITPGVDYVMLATCKGFLNHKEEIKTGPSKSSEEHVLQFPLASITAPVLIDNIFYDLDKATLRTESAKSLDKLVTLLKENPHVTIEIGAHCDYRGSNEYNRTLSQKRAENVVKYLIDKGIKKERLTPMGYGKTIAKTVKKKLTEKYPWLKEGDRLTEDFIREQTKENQEICNQLNRRTEFTVRRTTYNMFDNKGKLINSSPKS